MPEWAGMMADQTTKAEELALRLAKAIELGDKETSIECAGHLAELCAQVTVQLKQEAYPKPDINLRVSVEDAGTLTALITLKVHADMTVLSLKNLVSKVYNFDPKVQKWVIGQRLPRDQETLHYHGIRRDGDTAYLYILSAKQAKLSPELLEKEQHQHVLEEVTLEPRGTGDLMTNAEVEVMPAPRVKPPVPPKPPEVGWACPECTYINKPTRPGCMMCSTERPANYTVPDIYKPDEEELARLHNEELAMMQYEQQERERTEELFQALLLQQLTLLDTDGAVAEDLQEAALMETVLNNKATLMPPHPGQQPPC